MYKWRMQNSTPPTLPSPGFLQRLLRQLPLHGASEPDQSLQMAAQSTAKLFGTENTPHDTVKPLAIPVPPVMAARSCEAVYELFIRDRSLQSLAVVEQDRPVGLVNRHVLIDRFARRYTREIFGKKPISRLMDSEALVVDAATALDDLARIIIEDEERFLYEGFIITTEGRYLGMGTGHALLKQVNERKQAYLYHMAYHDVLTGLPNRQLFYDRLEQSLGQARRLGSCLAVLYIDLDHFKAVNDTLGHPAGDQLLLQTASRLGACLRDSDTLARLGGDEFAAVLYPLARAADAALVCEKVLRAVAAPCHIQGQQACVTASVGVSLYPGEAASVEGLVRQADNAVYHSKESRNQYRFFTADMNALVSQHQALDSEVRLGLERGEFLLHYQPQVDLTSGRITGAEALVRWSHPERGLLGPGEFVAFCEENGLILPLSERVLEMACAQAADWRAAGLAPLSVAINLSAHQFRRPDLAEQVLKSMAMRRLPSHALEVEITETTAMTHGPEALAILQTLRASGVRVCLDDFGTGYSSLSYLKSLPIDVLKIDRSFVASLGSGDGVEEAIVQAILTMARSLRMEVVAEGVETEAQREWLKSRGCTKMQGYLFSRPLPPEEFWALVKKNTQETAP
jgi:diguanylate cyclase (GGDEF)-like protein